MNDGIQIARGFHLPLDAVTETFGILAKRGSGKTYTAKVMVEGMLDAKAHVAVLDPIGVWWGLRTAADGEGEGYPILVLGGEHGDLPLEADAGTVIADLVMDGHSVVLDLSLMRKGDQRKFSTAFLERLYHKNRAALHLVLEEADMVAPQRPVKGAERLLGAAEDIVRRGRSRGIGVTMITQRPAVIHKDVLTQIETLIALRMTGPQDQKAIDAWVQFHGDQDLRKRLMAALPSLPVGEAIVWSPGWLGEFKRIKVRKLQTFDSSSTPKHGSPEASTRTVATVDLDALKAQMAATVERVEANDPRRLKAEVRDLTRRLKAQEAAAPGKEVVEVSILTADDHDLLTRAAGGLDGDMQAIEATITDLEALQARLGAVQSAMRRKPATPAPAPRRPVAPVVRVATAAGGPVSRPQQAILDALSVLEAIGVHEAPKVQVALLAGASPKSSAFGNNLGALRNAQDRYEWPALIEYRSPGTISLTPEGRGMADATAAPATVEEMHRFVHGLVKDAKWRLLSALINVYPEALSKQELADAAGASMTSSAFGNNLGSLRSLGLLDYPQPGHVVATPVLFLEAMQ